MGKYLLGLDEGTTGCKAVIFDFEGAVMGSDYREYPCYYPHPGWVEQTAEDITPALYATIKATIADAGVDPKEIVAMAISSQGGVSGFLDKDANLLRPFIGWQDLRGIPYIEKVKERIPEDEYYAISGGLVEGGTAVMVMGTFGSCFVGMDKPFRDPNGKLVVKGNVGPNNWTMEGMSMTAAASYRWYRDTFGGLEVAAGRLLRKDPYVLINEQIDSVPPGANGISFLSCLQSLAGRRDDPPSPGEHLLVWI